MLRLSRCFDVFDEGEQQPTAGEAKRFAAEMHRRFPRAFPDIGIVLLNANVAEELLARLNDGVADRAQRLKTRRLVRQFIPAHCARLPYLEAYWRWSEGDDGVPVVDLDGNPSDELEGIAENDYVRLRGFIAEGRPLPYRDRDCTLGGVLLPARCEPAAIPDGFDLGSDEDAGAFLGVLEKVAEAMESVWNACEDLDTEEAHWRAALAAAEEAASFLFGMTNAMRIYRLLDTPGGSLVAAAVGYFQMLAMELRVKEEMHREGIILQDGGQQDLWPYPPAVARLARQNR